MIACNSRKHARNSMEMPSAHQFSLRLFGGFALERDGLPCELAYEKGRALLAYLAIEGRAHTREALAAMFWPDLAREGALTNLRQVLHDLRRVLNAGQPTTPLLQTSRDTVSLRRGCSIEVDVDLFCDPANDTLPGPAECARCRLRTQPLVERHGGEFLAGCTPLECPQFETWLYMQREEWHGRILGLLGRLADCCERAGDPQRALMLAQTFLAREPWNETGLMRVMRLQARAGRRLAALAAYEACCRALREELDVLPSAATRELADSIRYGDPLPAPASGTATAPACLAQQAAERRQVTVVYCKLTPVDTDNPEEVLSLLQLAQVRCFQIVHAHSGYPVQSHGGSFLAYFGYPQAVENAARLAIEASLALTHAEFADVQPSAGVHTGVVITGSTSQLPDAIGTTSGIAIRMQRLADPGEVIISATTERLVTGYFECGDRTEPSISGARKTLASFLVQRSSGARDRLQAAEQLTPFIGRLERLAELHALWQETRAGAARFALLRGDPGIGKSRLALQFQCQLPSQSYRARVIRCFPEHSQSPFFALTALLGKSLAFASDDSSQARFDKLVAGLETAHAVPNPAVVAHFASIMGLPLPPAYMEKAQVSPRQQRDLTLEFALDYLYRLTERKPVLLLVEDLHWADPSTLEFIKRLIEQRRPAPILAVLTARPEFRPDWPQGLVRTLSLNALGTDETTRLVAAVAPQVELATVQRIVARADGVPLFAEEMAKMASHDSQSVIPETLHDLLAARIDGLSEAKHITQWAATLGRQFDIGILQEVAGCSAERMTDALGIMRDAGLIQGVGKGCQQFKHALIQEAAYESQTQTARQGAHRRIAEVLQSEFLHLVNAHPELLAQHWRAAGDNGQSIDYWLKAGTRALKHSACLEAVAHFQAGLALVPTLAGHAGLGRRELGLQIGLGAAACAVEGYASETGAKAYQRAVELCHQQETDHEAFFSAWGLWASASSRLGYGKALELAQQLQRMAAHSKLPLLEQQAHFALGDTLYWCGDFCTALTHLNQVEALYRREHHLSHVAGFGEDAGVTNRAYRGWLLWFCGFPDQAQQVCAQSLTLARGLGHPFSLAYALTFAAILHCRLRDWEGALNHADEALAIANRHDFGLWRIGGSIARGWALARQGIKEGTETLQQCVEMTRLAMGGVSLVVLGPLIDAHLGLGNGGDALIVQAEAVAVARALGDRHIDSELQRLKGEALLLEVVPIVDRDLLVESCFREALSIAKHQYAKSLELRAAHSLARLWQAQGRHKAALKLLSATYDGFSEGFDTPDLQDASKLIGELRAATHHISR